MSWLSSLVNKSLVSGLVTQVTKWLKERAIHIPDSDLAKIDTLAVQLNVKAKQELDKHTAETQAALRKVVGDCVASVLAGKVSSKVQTQIVETVCTAVNEQLVAPTFAMVESMVQTNLNTMASNAKQYVRDTENKVASQIADEFAKNVNSIIKL